MSSSDPSTRLTSQKQQFLTSQIRLLSAPLTTPTSNIDLDLPKNQLGALTDKINQKIRRHNQLVFPLQSQRHILEQVSAVYWRDALSRVYDDENAEYMHGGEDGTLVKKNDDLSEEKTIESLPDKWNDVVARPTKRRRLTRNDPADASPSTQAEDTHADDDADQSDTNSTTADDQEEEYTALRDSLCTQAARRAELNRKLKQYKRLQELLKPLENAKENVQPNLAYKEPELETELDRLRVLCARVGEKVRSDELGKRKEVHDKEHRIHLEDTSQTAKLDKILTLS